MTREGWMDYCWMRDFTFVELQQHSVDLNMEPPPTEQEYKEFCETQNQAMDIWLRNVTGK